LIFYDSWGIGYGENNYYDSNHKYVGNIYDTLAACEADSIKAEYHNLGYKPEFTNIDLLYTKRPCIFLPANTELPALVIAGSYSSISSPIDKWWRAYYNKTSSGNNFCLEGGKDYNKYSTSCYCQQMP
jgi:hypothetical protein